MIAEVTIYVAGFQTVAIFMQTGVSEKPVAGAVSVRNIVEDSSNKVCFNHQTFFFFCVHSIVGK